tara:strand:- start:307 stop:468 length:162 start_codon:yes stop_codon:yes gene_type:complete
MKIRVWGNSKLYYCPEEKKVWQKVAKHINKKGYEIYLDMPTYGLERKKLRENN